MTTIKAIETRYKGYRFRSRLEARWAVFFDALGVVWEYEKEGYDLAGAGAYLPDFWLPVQQVWVEVKGLDPNAREERVARALATASDRPVSIVGGAWETRFCSPEYSLGIGRMYYPASVCRSRPLDAEATLYRCDDCGLFRIASLSDDDWKCSGCGRDCQALLTDSLVAAMVSARAARFEHGETPTPQQRPQTARRRRTGASLSSEQLVIAQRMDAIDAEMPAATASRKDELVVEKMALFESLRALGVGRMVFR